MWLLAFILCKNSFAHFTTIYLICRICYSLAPFLFNASNDTQLSLLLKALGAFNAVTILLRTSNDYNHSVDQPKKPADWRKIAVIDACGLPRVETTKEKSRTG